MSNLMMFDSEPFHIYCSLDVFLSDSWVSAVSAGSAARGRPEVFLPSSLSSPSIWRLIGWMLSWLAWGRNASTFLMHFYVQANWQWRAPSFRSINISPPIWLQIWGVTPRIQMGFLSRGEKLNRTLCEFDLCELYTNMLQCDKVFLENHLDSAKTKQ